MSEKVKLAELQAREAHKGQMYGDRPYIEHVEDTVAKVQEWMEDMPHHEEVTIVAWLHDVLEDTEWPESSIIRDYGLDITDAVLLCTDPKGQPNRRAKKAVLYANFAHAMGLKKEYAAIAKCADRYANQQNTIITRNIKKAEMYIKEFPTFMLYFGYFQYHQNEAIWRDLFQQYGRMVTMVERVKGEKV